MKKRNVISDAITTLLFLGMVALTVIAYEWSFWLEGEFVNEFKFLSAAFFISAVSYFVYWAIRSLHLSGRAARITLAVVFFAVYLVLCILVLSFSFLSISVLFEMVEDGWVAYLFWGIFILMVIAYPLFYFYFWRRTFLRSFTTIIILVLSVLLVLIVPFLVIKIVTMILGGFGKFLRAVLPPSSGDSRQKYEFTNSMGCTETVYSSDGKDFYSSSGELRGTSNDGGKTITPR